MGPDAEHSPAEWFEEAARWYVEGHQACPWCRERHCLFRSEWAGRLEYHCSSCDFSACQDHRSGLHFAADGRGPRRPAGISRHALAPGWHGS
jgi:hypothetical protein